MHPYDVTDTRAAVVVTSRVEVTLHRCWILSTNTPLVLSQQNWERVNHSSPLEHYVITMIMDYGLNTWIGLCNRYVYIYCNIYLLNVKRM